MGTSPPAWGNLRIIVALANDVKDLLPMAHAVRVLDFSADQQHPGYIFEGARRES